MSSIIRRAGAKLLTLIERTADPGGSANRVQVYPKDVSGTSQLFVQDSAGGVHQLTPSAGAGREALGELWVQNNIAASQTGQPLSAQVSPFFDQVTAIRSGSIVGINSRLTEGVSAGTLTLTVTINEVPGTLTVVSTSGSNALGGQSTQATGIDTFVAGDTIAIAITTTATFSPITADIQAWLEIDTQ